MDPQLATWFDGLLCQKDNTIMDFIIEDMQSFSIGNNYREWHDVLSESRGQRMQLQTVIYKEWSMAAHTCQKQTYNTNIMLQLMMPWQLILNCRQLRHTPPAKHLKQTICHHISDYKWPAPLWLKDQRPACRPWFTVSLRKIPKIILCSS